MTTIPIHQQLTRISNALIIASFVTAGLLLLMQYLIKSDLAEPEPLPGVDFGSVYYKEVKIVDIVDEEEEIDDPQDPPPLPPESELFEESDPGALMDERFGGRVRPSVNPVIDIGGGAPMPLVKAQPVYSIRAIERGIEGYVDIEFDIGKSGATENLRIVGYEPSAIFNREVLKAVAKWRYRPKMVDGKPVAVYGVTERVRFEMEK